MTFDSLEEIKEYFGITADSDDELRKELKQMLSKFHPDKTGGDFKSKKQQKDYEELNQAIVFVDKTNTELTITRKEWADVLQKLDDLSVFQTKSDIATENEFFDQLNNGIQTSIVSFSKKHLASKITSILIASILTALWAFPGLIEKNENIKKFVDPGSTIFSLVWLCCIVLVAVFWVYIKIQEKKDDVMKKSYALDATQNRIFKLFLAWFHVLYSEAVKFEKFPDDTYRHIYSFTKDDLMNFLIHYYDQLSKEFESALVNNEYEIYRTLQDAYGKDKSRILEVSRRRNSSRFFVPYSIPGKMDLDLAQNIANTLVGKLLSKKIITTGDRRTLSESYRYIEDKG